MSLCRLVLRSHPHPDDSPFSGEQLEYKNNCQPSGRPLLCQDKIYSLPTASSVFLPPLPELYLPRIILNCLLSEIYSVKPSDSPRRTHLGDFMWGYWECRSCRPNNDKWRDRFSSLCASPPIVPLSGAAIMSLMAQSPSTLRGKHAEA